MKCKFNLWGLPWAAELQWKICRWIGPHIKKFCMFCSILQSQILYLQAELSRRSRTAIRYRYAISMPCRKVSSIWSYGYCQYCQELPACTVLKIWQNSTMIYLCVWSLNICKNYLHIFKGDPIGAKINQCHIEAARLFVMRRQKCAQTFWAVQKNNQCDGWHGGTG